VVERVPGKGYQVTLAEGHHAKEWHRRALDFLDILGQPDPKGPTEYYRWVGPIAPSGEYVSVSVKLLPNGEARYHQAWYQAGRPATRPTRSINLLILALNLMILVLLVVVAVGASAGRTLFSPRVSAPPVAEPESGNSPGNGHRAPSPQKTHPRMRFNPDLVRRLDVELAASADVRAKLKDYLTQPGLAADPSLPVVDERRSVKLIADLDTKPPPQETIRLTNIEVGKVVRLLETLHDWKASPQPTAPSDD
jgi:hypothetical protein